MNAKKMILLPADSLERMKTPTSTYSDKIKNLDSEMEEILNRKDISDSEKWSLYTNVLQRYLNVSKSLREPVPIPVLTTEDEQREEESKDKKAVLDTLSHALAQSLSAIPKSFQPKAEVLFNILLDSNEIYWDRTGEVKIGDEELIGSNITDLISDVLRARKSFNPVGWEKFSKLLAKLNVPQEIVRNPKRWQFIQSNKLMQEGSPRGSPTEYPQKINRRYSTQADILPDWLRFDF